MKNSFYFQHDNNARNDEKVLMLRDRFGNEGYALYFMILESMASTSQGGLQGGVEGGLQGGLYIGFGVAKDRLQSFIEYCIEIGLFFQEGSFFYSKRMHDHLAIRQAIIDGGIKGGKASWKARRGASRGGSTPASTKERKGKERKESAAPSAHPPTAFEVEEYGRSIGFELSGSKFVNHYAANGWMRGKTRISDWRALVNYWKENDKNEHIEKDGVPEWQQTK